MPEQKYKVTKIFVIEDLEEHIRKPTYREAVRIRGPLYDALIRELFEEGCVTSGCYFKMLVKRENMLHGTQAIRERAMDRREFLLPFFENVKKAESAARIGKTSGMLICLQILYECMKQMEELDTNFDWLKKDIYDIIARIAFRCDPKQICLNEAKVRIFYKHASYILTTGENIDEAVHLLYTALNLARAMESWKPDTEPERKECANMHIAVARKLIEAYLGSAREIFPTNLKTAMEFAEKAIMLLAEVGMQRNKKLVCDAYVEKMRVLVEIQDFKAALRIVVFLQDLLGDMDSPEIHKLFCEVHKVKGICFYNLDEMKKAFNEFKMALLICRKHQFPHQEAEIYFYLGKTHMKTPNESRLARKAFDMSKSIYATLEENENCIKLDYMLAKLKSDEIFSPYLSMLRKTNYCNWYNLLKWKYLCKPFWPGAGLDDFVSMYDIEKPSTKSSTLSFHQVEQEESAAGYDSMIDELHIETDKIEKSSSHAGIDYAGFPQKKHSLYCLLDEFPEIHRGEEESQES